jgi:hypothetical protein
LRRAGRARAPPLCGSKAAAAAAVQVLRKILPATEVDPPVRRSASRPLAALPPPTLILLLHLPAPLSAPPRSRPAFLFAGRCGRRPRAVTRRRRGAPQSGYKITRWGLDPHSRGSYSFVSVGCGCAPATTRPPRRARLVSGGGAERGRVVPGPAHRSCFFWARVAVPLPFARWRPLTGVRAACGARRPEDIRALGRPLESGRVFFAGEGRFFAVAGVATSGSSPPRIS